MAVYGFTTMDFCILEIGVQYRCSAGAGQVCVKLLRPNASVQFNTRFGQMSSVIKKMLSIYILLLSFIHSIHARSAIHGPVYLEPHENRTEGETMYSFRELHLIVKPTKYGEHSTHHLAHRFDRLKHPHSNPDLWHFVKDKCEETWSVTKPDDHHFAASVDIEERVVSCWSGYHNSDVVSWQNLAGFVTFLPAIEALGNAPKALWYTDKWDVHHHGPEYRVEGHDPDDL